MTPPGIDAGTVRLVAQRLNHYATTGPIYIYIYIYIYIHPEYIITSNLNVHMNTGFRITQYWYTNVPYGAWLSVCCECCVLSGRGQCEVLITRPEESYRLWCVVECELETS